MEGLHQYALRLIIGALICGIGLSMVHKGPQEALLRFLSGIFLTVMLLSPITKGRITLEPDLFREALDMGEDQAAVGAEMAMQELHQRISAGLEAYILDKAGQWNTELDVTVSLDEDCLPVRAVLSGEIPESVQQELSRVLTQDLGILKENQLWIG